MTAMTFPLACMMGMYVTHLFFSCSILSFRHIFILLLFSCVGAMFMWMTIMTVLGHPICCLTNSRRVLSFLGITTVEAFAYARSSLRLWDWIRRHVTVAFDGQPVMQWLFPWKVIFSRISGSSQK
jgi:hypothetical protein